MSDPYDTKYMFRRRRGKRGKRARKVAQATKRYVNRAISARIPSNYMVEETGSAVEISTTAGFINLSDAISRSVASQSGRLTDVLKWRDMEVSMHLYPKSTSGDVDTVRLWLVQWKQDNNQVAFNAVSKFLYDSGTAPILLSGEIESDKDHKMIWDSGLKLVGPYLDTATTGVRLPNGGNPKIMKFRIPGKKFLQTRFNVGGDTGSNHIYLVHLGSFAGSSTNNAFLNYKIRLHFTNV